MKMKTRGNEKEVAQMLWAENTTSIVNMHYRYLEVTTKCPQCNKETRSDLGSGFMPNLKSDVTFFCNEHGEFNVKMHWGTLVKKFIEGNLK